MDTVNIVNQSSGISPSGSSPSLSGSDHGLPLEKQAATESEQQARLSMSAATSSDSDDVALEKRFGMKNEFVR